MNRLFIPFTVWGATERHKSTPVFEQFVALVPTCEFAIEIPALPEEGVVLSTKICRSMALLGAIKLLFGPSRNFWILVPTSNLSRRSDANKLINRNIKIQFLDVFEYLVIVLSE